MSERPYYFAYGSNMNPERVSRRGLATCTAAPAKLRGVRLSFDKSSGDHPGGHANLVFGPDDLVEGVLYRLADQDEIRKMDVFEATPFNYSRECVLVESGTLRIAAWTYFANPAVTVPGLRPARDYLAHLLAGRPYLSERYYRRLAAIRPCDA